jgi:hypothetical protein
MEAFTSDGVFWLPDIPEHRVPGRLSLAPGGLALKMFAALREFTVPSTTVVRSGISWVEIPVLHGRLHDGTEVTLLSVSGYVLQGPFHAVEEGYRVEVSLAGGLITATTFDRALCQLDVLNGWAHPAPLARDVFASRSGDEVSIRTGRLLLGEAICEDRVVRLVSDAVGTWGDSVDLKQVASLEIEGEPLIIDDVVGSWIRPLQDMLVVALGRPAVLTGLVVRPADAAPHEDLLSVSFDAIQPQPTEQADAARIRMFDAPTLLLPDNEYMPFAFTNI